MNIKNAFKHLKKICVHKWWVFYYCCKAGIIWQGIVHDLSKFTPTEFFESVKYYKGTSSPIDECKRVNGYSMAWFSHKGKNYHHYEHWTDNYDIGTTCVPMPFKYALEMYCDYLAAGKAYNGRKFTYHNEFAWWIKIKKPTVNMMHPKTKQFITDMLWETVWLRRCLNKSEALKIYNNIHNND